MGGYAFYDVDAGLALEVFDLSNPQSASPIYVRNGSNRLFGNMYFHSTG
jgi:hypothetical protein